MTCTATIVIAGRSCVVNVFPLTEVPAMRVLFSLQPAFQPWLTAACHVLSFQLLLCTSRTLLAIIDTSSGSESGFLPINAGHGQ